jgi:hypothetical protein
VGFIDNQTSEYGNLTTPLHLAIKKRIARVGITVVDEPAGAYMLKMRIGGDERGSGTPVQTVLMLQVTFHDPKGKLIDGPEGVNLESRFDNVHTSTTVDEEAQRGAWVRDIAKLIVRRFFRDRARLELPPDEAGR